MWWRVPGGFWLEGEALMLSGDCSSAQLVGQPTPRSVLVTFALQAPASTEGEVFSGGSFPGTDIPAWTPYAVMLMPEGGAWSVTLWLPVGSEVEHIYNRGDWGRVERPASSGETPPCTLTVGEQPLTVEDQVQKWHDLDGCERSERSRPPGVRPPAGYAHLHGAV